MVSNINHCMAYQFPYNPRSNKEHILIGLYYFDHKMAYFNAV